MAKNSKSKLQKKQPITGDELAVGGQALIEGVLMRSNDKYAISVRKSNGKIITKTEKLPEKTGIALILRKTPFIRGIFALVDSTKLGYKALNYSADIFVEDEDEKISKSNTKEKSPIINNKKEKSSKTEKAFEGALGIFVIIISIAFAIGIFKFLPYLLSGFVVGNTSKYFTIVEGIIKAVIFVGYILLVSLSKEIRRVFQYHGAEHKSIHCYERFGNTSKLNATNAAKCSRIHPRCGTTFLFLVIFVSIVVYTFLPRLEFWSSFGLRLLFLPVIAGISYEILRIVPKMSNRNPIKWMLYIIEIPGLLLQKITTKEPDKKQLEVAINSLKRVL